MKKEDNKYVPLVKHNKIKKQIQSNAEASIVKRTTSKAIKVLALVGIVLMSIIVFGAIIDIFDFFYKLHPYAGYSVLALLILLLLILVLRPIVIALATPCFTLDVLDNESKSSLNRKNYRKLKMVANNLVKGDDISEESKKNILDNLNDRNDLNIALRDIYDKEISKQINKIVNESATKVLISTAISQNNKIDTATVILVNIRMIMRIVIKCGYHPSYPQLYKLIAKVFRNAILAYTLQSINVDEVIFEGINKLVKGALTSIPFVSDFTKSLTQGAANALLTLRIGIITRKYLYEEFDIQAMIENPEEQNVMILEEAVEEANDNIESIVDEFKKSRKMKNA